MSAASIGSVTVRPATVEDAAAVAALYNHYVTDTVITFEVEPVSERDMAARIGRILDVALPYVVATNEADEVVGFAYAAPYQERAAYAHSVETSIYLRIDAAGGGTGTALYSDVFAGLRALAAGDSPHAPVHRAYARIALPNDASVALHEKFGLRRLATLSEVGRKFETWIDVGLWELKMDGSE